MAHNMQYTLLDNHISKESDFNPSRKVAWLRSDRRFQLAEGVYASFPYYLIEGEVRSNAQKMVARAKELGYNTLMFGERGEIQHTVSRNEFLPFESMDIILKLQFENPVLELLNNRKYLLEASHRERLRELLRMVSFPFIKGIYWQLTPVSPALLQDPEFRSWTEEELLLKEIEWMEEVFCHVPLLIAEVSRTPIVHIHRTTKTILSSSCYQGWPWEEYKPLNLLLQRGGGGLQKTLVLRNRGMVMQGEGLWPIQSAILPFKPCWGICDFFNQFPADERLQADWGLLGMEIRLLWMKILQAKAKGSIQKIQWEAWGNWLKELEQREEENPLIAHFVTDARHFLAELQSQPILQGGGAKGYWKGRSLMLEPSPDDSFWYKNSRLFH